MGLQVYYIIVSLYGWYYWVKGKKKEDEIEIPVTRINLRNAGYYTLIFAALYSTMFFILYRFTDSPIPGLDSLATALSLVATWMLAKKILENWLLWIIADALCIGISYYKDLYFTSVLFGIYTIMAFVGYYRWKKDL